MNIALIGYGYWGRVWRTVLERTPDVRLSLIFHRGAANDGIFTNDRNALTSSHVDAAIVATPTPSHYALVEFLLRNRKHVLCEKPLALRLRQALDLATFAENNDLILETNFTYLHSPAIRYMRQHLEALGKVHAIESHIDGFGNFYPQEDVYSVHCPHILALVVAMFPNVSFSVATKDLVFSQAGTVDVGIIHLRADSLAVAIHSSLRSITRVRRIAVYGSHGVMEYDATASEQLKIKLYTAVEERLVERTSESRAFDESRNVDHSLRAFLRCIHGAGMSNTQLALQVTALLERISDSIPRGHRTGRLNGHS